MNSACDEIHETTPCSAWRCAPASTVTVALWPRRMRASCGSVTYARTSTDDEVGDPVERLPRLHHLAGARVRREHGARDRVLHVRLSQTLGDLVDLRVDGGHLRMDRLRLRPRGLNLRGLSRDLTLVRFNLLVLRHDLIGERALLALGLIELLRRGRLLREQPVGPIVGALGDLVLRGQRRALRPRGVALRDRRAPLRLENGDLLPDFVDARRGRRRAAQTPDRARAPLRRIDRADRRAGARASARRRRCRTSSRPAASALTDTSVASTLP